MVLPMLDPATEASHVIMSPPCNDHIEEMVAVVSRPSVHTAEFQTGGGALPTEVIRATLANPHLRRFSISIGPFSLLGQKDVVWSELQGAMGSAGRPSAAAVRRMYIGLGVLSCKTSINDILSRSLSAFPHLRVLHIVV